MTRTSPYADSHATTTRIVEPWQNRALCRGRSDEWDLDEIGDDPLAIRAAVAECRRCPSLAACEAFTASLPKSKQPKDLIQAGRVWTDRTSVGRSITKDEREEVNVDQLRASHAQYVRRVSVGLGVTPDLLAEERAYQRWRKREQKKAAT